MDDFQGLCQALLSHVLTWCNGVLVARPRSTPAGGGVCYCAFPSASPTPSTKGDCLGRHREVGRGSGVSGGTPYASWSPSQRIHRDAEQRGVSLRRASTAASARVRTPRTAELRRVVTVIHLGQASAPISGCRPCDWARIFLPLTPKFVSNIGKCSRIHKENARLNFVLESSSVCPASGQDRIMSDRHVRWPSLANAFKRCSKASKSSCAEEPLGDSSTVRSSAQSTTVDGPRP